MPGSALLVGRSHAVGAGCADGVAAAVVFVVGGDVADRFVQPDAVVVDPDAFEFGGEGGGVGDRRQVWVLAFDVAPQRLDPCLVGRGRWAAEVLGDRAQRHEPAGLVGVHLGPVVRDRQQQRRLVAVGERGVGVGEAGSVRRARSSSVSSPSLSSPRLNRTRAATESGLAMRCVEIHLRDTTSTIAYACLAAAQRSNWEPSQYHSWFGRHSHQCGHGVFTVRAGRGTPCRARP